MITRLTHATVVVRDHDEALTWYTETLGLEPRSDDTFGEGFRWVTVGVKGQDAEIVLHVPHEGASPGSGVHGLVFSTDHCRADVEGLRAKGAEITMGPEEVPWGVQAVFEDPFGNSHVLVQPPPAAAS